MGLGDQCAGVDNRVSRSRFRNYPLGRYHRGETTRADGRKGATDYQVRLFLFQSLQCLIFGPSRNQDYENFVAAKDYQSAILLALSLDQPRRLLNLFAALSASSPRSLAAESTYTGSSAVDRAIASLDDTNLYILLEFCRDWNTSLRTADVAQTVLYTIFKSFSAEKLLLLKSNDPTSGSNVSAIIEALLPYTERHFSRADKLLAQDSAIVEYTLSAMSMTDYERMDA